MASGEATFTYIYFAQPFQLLSFLGTRYRRKFSSFFLFAWSNLLDRA